MDSLPPIPTPPSQRWREFRIQILPLVIFLITLVAIAMMWRNFVQPSGVVGQVEAIQANVISLSDGVITDLMVERFQVVTNGQLLGAVQTTDPEMLKASLAALQSDLKLLQAQMRLDERRVGQSYQQLTLDILKEEVALELARVQAIVASNTLNRTEYLVKEGLETSLVLDIDRSAKDALDQEIKIRMVNIANWREAVKNAAPGQDVINDPVIREAIQAKEEELAQTLKPSQLRSPMDGVVSAIFRRTHERIVRGEPIVTVAATKAAHVVGYIRQPVNALPNVDDAVFIRTRSQKRQVAEGKIVKVGAQYELINPALLSTDSNRVEMGLPILVSLPQNLSVSPGEFVDLAIRPAGSSAKAF